MKTQVNLYSPKLHPRLRLLTLAVVSIIWLIFLLLGLGLYAYVEYQNSQQQGMLTNIQQQNARQSEVVASLETDLANFKADPILVNQVNQKQQQVLGKERVLKELAGQSHTEKSGFALLMYELASQHHKDIGLQHVMVDQRNIVIKGVAERASSVPVWMNQLTNTQFFAGKTFNQTNITKTEQQLTFTLSSMTNAAATGGAGL
jgi:Tfp pilus assembly protein PilN